MKITFKKDGLSGDNLKLVEDLEKRFNEIPDSVAQSELDKEIEKRMAPIKDLNIEQIKELLGDGENSIRSVQKKLGEKITEIEGKGNPKEDMSIRGQVATWQKRNKDIVAKIKAGQKAAVNDLEPFELRAANSPMTPTNTYLGDTISVSAGSVIRMGGEVFDLHRTQPTLWDYLPKGRTSLELYPWVNKKVPADSGAAAFIGPGVAKPGVSFTFEVESSNAKKVAVSMKMATEILDDIDGMTSYVQAELAYQLKIRVNAVLATGTLSSTSPAGVRTYSQPFSTSGLATQNPNNWDVARALVAQHRAAFIDGEIVIFMNPIDTANMDMAKAVSQGTYMGLNVRQVPGAIIVEDYNVPVGYVQSLVVNALKILIYKDFTMKWGWENDDFTKNLVTAIAEMRIHVLHSENDAQAFIYDDIADIKSQIAII